jgi:hypothetical protein
MRGGRKPWASLVLVFVSPCSCSSTKKKKLKSRQGSRIHGKAGAGERNTKLCMLPSVKEKRDDAKR